MQLLLDLGVGTPSFRLLIDGQFGARSIPNGTMSIQHGGWVFPSGYRQIVTYSADVYCCSVH